MASTRSTRPGSYCLSRFGTSTRRPGIAHGGELLPVLAGGGVSLKDLEMVKGKGQVKGRSLILGRLVRPGREIFSQTRSPSNFYEANPRAWLTVKLNRKAYKA